MNVFAVIDDVSEIDTHAEVEPTYRQPLLHCDSTFNGRLHCRELGEEAVAGVLYDVAGVTGYGGIDDV